MGTKDIDSTSDDMANKANQMAARATEGNRKAARKGGDAVSDVKNVIAGKAKKVGDRVQETVEKVRHGVQEMASKAAHVAHELTQKAAHTVKETATKAEHRGHGLIDKAGDELKRH